MYDATLGRFLERDPIGPAAGGTNLYEYAEDDPADRDDPSGMLSLDECQKKVKAFLDDLVVYNQRSQAGVRIFNITGWKPGAKATTEEQKLLKYLVDNKCVGVIECSLSKNTPVGAITTGCRIVLNASQQGGWNGQTPTLKHEMIHSYDECRGAYANETPCMRSLLREIRAYRYEGACTDAKSCFERAAASATVKKYDPATGLTEQLCTPAAINKYRGQMDALYQKALKAPVPGLARPK